MTEWAPLSHYYAPVGSIAPLRGFCILLEVVWCSIGLLVALVLLDAPGDWVLFLRIPQELDELQTALALPNFMDSYFQHLEFLSPTKSFRR